MKRIPVVALPVVAWLSLWSLRGAVDPHSAIRQTVGPTLANKLDTRVEHFDNGGRPLAISVVDLAFTYQIPMSLEYVDRKAVTGTVNLKLVDTTPRRILETLIAKTPGYRVTFLPKIVEVFSPELRAVPTNLFNKVIPEFDVEEVDPLMLDFELSCALQRTVLTSSGCGGSHPVGSSEKVSMHMKGARVYEILDAIVARRGLAIWSVAVEPERFTALTQRNADPWCVYPLDPSYKEILIDRLEALYPREK